VLSKLVNDCTGTLIPEQAICMPYSLVQNTNLLISPFDNWICNVIRRR
jgi:hypothetical protein